METLHRIVESRKKTLLIGFLLLAPQRSFTARELGKRLGMGGSTVTRELNDLVRKGMAKTFSKHNKAYYIIQPRHRLLADIQPSLVKHQRKYEDELFASILKLGRIRAAFLSGIFTGHPELPVDILLVGKVNLVRLQKFLDAAKAVMGNEINYSVMSEDEFRMRRDTFDRFIKDVFDYPSLTVVDHMTSKRKKFKVSHF